MLTPQRGKGRVTARRRRRDRGPSPSVGPQVLSVVWLLALAWGHLCRLRLSAGDLAGQPQGWYGWQARDAGPRGSVRSGRLARLPPPCRG